MQVLRTPKERFARLPDFPFAPSYTQIRDRCGVANAGHFLQEDQPEAIADMIGAFIKQTA